MGSALRISTSGGGEEDGQSNTRAEMAAGRAGTRCLLLTVPPSGNEHLDPVRSKDPSWTIVDGSSVDHVAKITISHRVAQVHRYL